MNAVIPAAEPIEQPWSEDDPDSSGPVVARVLREALADQTAGEGGSDELLAIMSGRKVQQLVTDMGLAGLLVPEDLGGTGVGLAAQVTCTIELGRAAYPHPYLSSALCAKVLLSMPRSDLVDAHLRRIAAGEPYVVLTDWRVDDLVAGQEASPPVPLEFVVEATAGSVFIALVERDGWVVAHVLDQAEVAPTQTLDLTRVVGTVAAESWGVELGPVDAGALRSTSTLRHLLLAAEALGGADAALAQSVEYAAVRHQFGRAIGSFQAVRHRCADMYVAGEMARAALYAARVSLDFGHDDAELLALTARSRALSAVMSNSSENIALHGAIGFTWEASCHLHYRRARLSSRLLGGPDHLHERACDLAVERSR